MTDREIMKQALEALELGDVADAISVGELMDALRERLAREEQEPVAWQWLDTGTFRKSLPASAEPGAWTPLYTAPPQRQPLTDDELDDIWIHRQCIKEIQRGDILAQFRAAGRAIERKHGIGGVE